MIAAHITLPQFEKLLWLEKQTGWSRSAVIRHLIDGATATPAIVKAAPLPKQPKADA